MEMVLKFFGVGLAIQKTVGVIVANWLIGKVVGLERFNDRVTKVNIGGNKSFIDSCHDGRDLFRIAKGLGRRKMLLGLVVLKIKEWR